MLSQTKTAENINIMKGPNYIKRIQKLTKWIAIFLK